MKRHRAMLAALSGVALAGCADAKIPTAAPADVAIGAAVSPVSALLALVSPVDDAATRAIGGLTDAGVAATLGSQLVALAESMRSGDLTASRAALRNAVTTFDAYEATAAKADQSDRAVIELVLDLVEGALREKPSRK